MTDAQKEHRAKLIQDISVKFHEKYEAGAIEHVGLLSDLSAEALLDNAIDEAIDQCAFLFTLRDTLKDFEAQVIQEHTRNKNE